MSDVQDKIATGVLVRETPIAGISYIGAMKKVRADHGVSLHTQVFEILRLAFGKNKLHPADYFNYGIYRPTLSAVEKRAFLSNNSITALNSGLISETIQNQSGHIDNKLLFCQLMKACDFPTLKNKAVFSPHRKFDFIQTLCTTQEITKYITTCQNAPLFGQPVCGSRGVGEISIIGRSQDSSTVTLGDGRQVDADVLAQEIAGSYNRGYLFRELLAQPFEVEEIIRKPEPKIRVVTVQSQNGPNVLYAIWKYPKEPATVDSEQTAGSTIALIDVETGKVVRCQDGYWLPGSAIGHSITTGAAIVGIQIPHWEKIRRLAVSAHELFADHGILGWDFTVTNDGPVINQADTNPSHIAYQQAADRGIMNDDFTPVFKEARRVIEQRFERRKSNAKVFSMSLLYGLNIGGKTSQKENPNKAFLTEVTHSNIDLFDTLDKVKKEHGRGPYSQAFEILKLAIGKNKISPEIYFNHALFRPSISKQEKKTYISRVSSTTINNRMAPNQLDNMAALTEDKLLSGSLLAGCGIPATRNTAVYMPDRNFRFIQTLKSADDIIGFITTTKNLPLFCKPMYGSRSLGGVSIVDCAKDNADEVILGNGQKMCAQTLATEIVKHYSMGYLFQELLTQPAGVQAVVGTTAATLKISTVMSEDGPELLYAVWKQPTPGQMIDGGGAGTSGLAHVDIETGKIIRVQEGNLLSGGPITHSVTTGGEILGMDVPNWRQSVDLVLSAHHLFSDHGILGWDIVLTTRGPVINEVNANTGHIIIQLASDQGFWNSQRRSILERGIAETDRKVAAHNSHKSSKSRFTIRRPA